MRIFWCSFLSARSPVRVWFHVTAETIAPSFLPQFPAESLVLCPLVMFGSHGTLHYRQSQLDSPVKSSSVI